MRFNQHFDAFLLRLISVTHLAVIGNSFIKMKGNNVVNEILTQYVYIIFIVVFVDYSKFKGAHQCEIIVVFL